MTRSLVATTIRELAPGLKTVGCVGKWHLGAHPQFHSNRRGLDEYFGLLGGGHVYLPGARGGGEYQIPMNRNGQQEPLDAIKQSGAAGVKTFRERLVANGRSTSGPAQKHGVEVSIHKRENLVFGKKAARAKAKRSKDS